MLTLILCYKSIEFCFYTSLGCAWKRRPPDMEGGCKYTEQAVTENQQGVLLQLGSWAWGQQPLTIKQKHVIKCLKMPQTWTDSLA